MGVARAAIFEAKKLSQAQQKMSESEQKLEEELWKAKEENAELEKSLDAMSKEVMHLRSQLFRFDNIHKGRLETAGVPH